MLFTAHPIVTTSHTESNKKEHTLKIAHGVITWISVLFPKGCHGLVFCAIYHHEHAIFPSTEGMYLTGDGAPIEWNEYYESYQPPYELKIKAWGEGCTYDHVLTVRVAVLPRKAVRGLAMIEALEKFLGLVFRGRIPGSS